MGIKHFYYLLRHSPKNDIFVLLTTFFLTVFTDLVVAVNVGVILAVLLFTRRMSQSVTIELESAPKLGKELKSAKISEIPKNVFIYSIQGPFFFAAAEKLEHTLEVIHEDPKTIIFRLNGVPFMDVTGLQTFHEIIEDLHKRGINVLLCEANPRVTQKLKMMEILKFTYKEQIYASLSEALKSL